MNKIKIDRPIIVEGKYDKIKLQSLVDALIVTTDGFGIFTDKEKRGFIKKLAEAKGIIVITDSDAAGFKIRGYLSGMIPRDKILHLYIPDILGKEKRKEKPSAEGKLGVEGIDGEILKKVLGSANVEYREEAENEDKITIADLYGLGFTGGENSREKRYKLYGRLGLPRRISIKTALPVINSLISREELYSLYRD